MSLNRRFVVLEHDHPILHWDLMLEFDGALLTWRLPANVQINEWGVSERLPDHRLAYLDYEGPVSKGRGTVRRITGGQYISSENFGRDPIGSDLRSDCDVASFELLECQFACSLNGRRLTTDAPEWQFQ